jgi:hypothetical protein
MKLMRRMKTDLICAHQQHQFYPCSISDSENGIRMKLMLLIEADGLS